jgi:hypothetical protein
MAKSKVSEWDSVASNNIILNGINIDEHCPPSAVNNAIREMMSQIKQWQSGTSGDDWTSSGVLNITGTLKLDGNLGTNGQVLTSKGSSATPVWKDLGLSTMAYQNANNVNITGGKITGLSKLETASGTVTASVIKGNEVKVGPSWTLHEHAGHLYFRYGGNNVLRLSPGGHLVAENNITAFQGV